MGRTNVESKNLKSVGYDSSSKTLEIEFNAGAVYEYTDVPQNIYDELMDAESKGRYFYKHIRSKFEYKKTEQSA